MRQAEAAFRDRSATVPAPPSSIGTRCSPQRASCAAVVRMIRAEKAQDRSAPMHFREGNAGASKRAASPPLPHQRTGPSGTAPAIRRRSSSVSASQRLTPSGTGSPAFLFRTEIPSERSVAAMSSPTRSQDPSRQDVLHPVPRRAAVERECRRDHAAHRCHRLQASPPAPARMSPQQAVHLLEGYGTSLGRLQEHGVSRGDLGRRAGRQVPRAGVDREAPRKQRRQAAFAEYRDRAGGRHKLRGRVQGPRQVVGDQSKFLHAVGPNLCRMNFGDNTFAGATCS